MAKKSYLDVQRDVIGKYNITIVENSTCWSRTHAHVQSRKVCKWIPKNSIRSTFTLFHEIGHIETTTGKMRRCEAEYYATVWAMERCNEYGLEIPESIIDLYQDYINMELDRGLRRHGKNLPNKEELDLRKVNYNTTKTTVSPHETPILAVYRRSDNLADKVINAVLNGSV